MLEELTGNSAEANGKCRGNNDDFVLQHTLMIGTQQDLIVAS